MRLQNNSMISWQMTRSMRANILYENSRNKHETINHARHDCCIIECVQHGTKGQGHNLLPQPIRYANRIDEKAHHMSEQTSKNCPAEAPEGDSIQDLSALCNAADPK
jgi:hypothetical protein